MRSQLPKIDDLVAGLFASVLWNTPLLAKTPIASNVAAGKGKVSPVAQFVSQTFASQTPSIRSDDHHRSPNDSLAITGDCPTNRATDAAASAPEISFPFFMSHLPFIAWLAGCQVLLSKVRVAM